MTEHGKPIHLRWSMVLLVAAGGVLGTLCRYVSDLLLPSPDGWPLATVLINLSGAFALGVLLERLSGRGPDAGGRRVLRLAAGTGFLGGFTTYSTLALDAVHLFGAGRSLDGALYLGISLLGGAAASIAGIRVAAWRYRGRAQPPQQDPATVEARS